MASQRILTGLVAAVLVLSSFAPCRANTRDRYYDVRDQFSSEQVIGPVILHVVGINPFTDTVGKWDTSSKDIPATDPSSIINVPGVASATKALDNAKPTTGLFAGTPPSSSPKTVTRKQAIATNQLVASIAFSGSQAALAKAIKSAPRTTAERIQDAILPANSMLRAVQNAPHTLLNLTTNKPDLVAKELSRARPSFTTATPTSQSPQPQTSAPPVVLACPDPLTAPALAPCLKNVVDDAQALYKPLMTIRDEFRELVVTADVILHQHRHVTGPVEMLALREDVLACIVDAGATCGLQNGSVTLTKTNLHDLANHITKGYDEFRSVNREYTRLAIAAAGLTNDSVGKPLGAQLKLVQTVLQRYQTIYSKLDAYSQAHLLPLTVADFGRTDVLLASGFEVQKIETCTGYANHGAFKTDVLNYVPSPTIDLGIKDDNKANNGVDPSPEASPDSTPDRTKGDQDKTAKPSPGPSGTPAGNDSEQPSPQTRHDDVTVVCEPPLFLSIGFGADSLPGTSYGSAAANSAGQAKPAAGATPVPSTLTSSNSGIGPTIVQLANYALTDDDSGGGLALSAGLATNAAFNSKARADALFGLSYALARTMVITGGVSFGPVTQLASGYRVNGPIVPGASVPTTSSNRAGAFFGITFVTTGSPKASASPSPEPSKAPKAAN